MCVCVYTLGLRPQQLPREGIFLHSKSPLGPTRGLAISSIPSIRYHYGKREGGRQGGREGGREGLIQKQCPERIHLHTKASNKNKASLSLSLYPPRYGHGFLITLSFWPMQKSVSRSDVTVPSGVCCFISRRKRCIDYREVTPPYHTIPTSSGSLNRQGLLLTDLQSPVDGQ